MAGKQSQKTQGDTTGRAKEQAEREAAEQQRERQQEMTMVTQQRAEMDRTGVFDPVSGEVIAENDDEVGEDAIIVGDEPPAEIEDLGVEVVDDDDTEKQVVWRSNGDYPQVTIGVGNTFDFEAGKRYKTSLAVYNHMEEKGCVWH